MTIKKTRTNVRFTLYSRNTGQIRCYLQLDSFRYYGGSTEIYVTPEIFSHFDKYGNLVKECNSRNVFEVAKLLAVIRDSVQNDINRHRAEIKGNKRAITQLFQESMATARAKANELRETWRRTEQWNARVAEAIKVDNLPEFYRDHLPEFFAELTADTNRHE